jgi:hypothetical protein
MISMLAAPPPQIYCSNAHFNIIPALKKKHLQPPFCRRCIELCRVDLKFSTSVMIPNRVPVPVSAPVPVHIRDRVRARVRVHVHAHNNENVHVHGHGHVHGHTDMDTDTGHGHGQRHGQARGHRPFKKNVSKC